MKLFGLFLFFGCALAHNGYFYHHKGPKFPTPDHNSEDLVNFPSVLNEKNVVQNSYVPPVPMEIQELQKSYIPPITHNVNNVYTQPETKVIQREPDNIYIPPPPAAQNTYIPPSIEDQNIHISQDREVQNNYILPNHPADVVHNTYSPPDEVAQNTYIPPDITLAPKLPVENTYVPPASETIDSYGKPINTLIPPAESINFPNIHFSASQISSDQAQQSTFKFPQDGNLNQPSQRNSIQQNNNFQTQTTFNRPFQGNNNQRPISFNQQSNSIGNNKDSTPIHEENSDVNHRNPYTNSLAKFIPHYKLPERNPNAPPAPTYEEQQIHKENIMNLKFISANLNYNLFNYTTTTQAPPSTSTVESSLSSGNQATQNNQVAGYNYEPMNFQGQNFGFSGPMTTNMNYHLSTIPNLSPVTNNYLPPANSYQQSFHVFAPVKSTELLFNH